MNHIRLLLLLLVLLAACGQADAGSGGPGPAPATADPTAPQPSRFSLLPGVPAHPAMERMLASQAPEAAVGLAGVTVSGVVEIRTAEVRPERGGMEGVLEFYVALLPTLGWEPVLDYAYGTLYRRPAAQGGDLGLFVSIDDGRLAEFLLFESKGPLPAFVASHARVDNLVSDSDPQGAAYNQAGELYVAFKRDHQVQRFDAAGKRLQAWGAQGAGPGLFGGEYNGPTGVAVGPDGSVFVIDPGNGRVQKFSPDGRFLAAFGAQHLEPGDSFGTGPTGIAAGPDGTIYLAYEDGILLFAPDGAFLRRWPAHLPPTRPYVSLDWLAVDDEGFVYATDELADVVQKYAPDGSFVTEWGGSGISPGRFMHPAGIASAGDRLYVVDSRLGRVQVFSRDGKLLAILGWENAEPAFSGGAGIAAAPDGGLLVADESATTLVLFGAAAQPPLVREHPPVAALPLPAPQDVMLLPARPSAEEWLQEMNGWLRGEPCAPPCWAGITPGVTTAGEALELLRRHPLVDPASVHLYYKEGLNFGHVSYELNWSWFDGSNHDNRASFAPAVPPTPTPTPSPTPTAGPTPTFEFRDEVIEAEAVDDDPAIRSQLITAISPGFDDYEPQLYGSSREPLALATLGEVIAAYGEPSHVLAVDGGDNWRTLNLVFERHGFALLASGAALDALAADFTPQTVVFAVDPAHEALAHHSAALLRPWQGMRPFAFYCVTEDGQPCN